LLLACDFSARNNIMHSDLYHHHHHGCILSSHLMPNLVVSVNKLFVYMLTLLRSYHAVIGLNVASPSLRMTKRPGGVWVGAVPLHRKIWIFTLAMMYSYECLHVLLTAPKKCKRRMLRYRVGWESSAGRPAIPMENGKIGVIITPKLQNRWSQNLSWVITLAMSPRVSKFKAIAPVGRTGCLVNCEINVPFRHKNGLYRGQVLVEI